jgi:hypothetical protein
MNESNDRLEILIGRLVDGEISPGERRVLERELEANGPARELLEQLRGLRQVSCEAVAAEVSGGASADQIFERAWQRHARPSYRRVFRMDRHVRFAVGLAAGLILGLALHFVAVYSKAPMQPAEPTRIASAIPSEIDGGAIVPTVTRTVSRPVTREVDWYVFTSPSGEQWLVEGIREGMTQTASYSGKQRPM